MAKMIYLKDWQKERIKELQIQGYKYEDIGLSVGLPPESTRSYCKRNDLPKGIPVNPLPPVPIYCASCGKEVEQTPHRKLKRYCCTQCRWDYANSHRDQTSRKFHVCVCAYCGVGGGRKRPFWVRQKRPILVKSIWPIHLFHGDIDMSL